ncbi:DUF3347 domain-containing protein [Ferruginibacter yonginensis]|uniref:DUF3347 domain-containing protein n=1 Tax=Ferruginibacter yonginensis TaxID=1310416 RepID=A0ABV8QMK4_9BACT
MKRLLIFIVAIAASFAIYWFAIRKVERKPEGPSLAPIALKKHSEGFNKSVDSIVNAYLAVKNAFVEADTAVAKQQTQVFISLIDRLPIDELKKDTALIFETVKGNLGDIKANALSLLQQKDITEMRKDFSMVTEMMYPSFFTSINYEGTKLYVQNCPMAFNDSIAASWISNSAEVVNPYLGKYHPTYKAGMLHCGDVKDSITAK